MLRHGLIWSLKSTGPVINFRREHSSFDDFLKESEMEDKKRLEEIKGEAALWPKGLPGFTERIVFLLAQIDKLKKAVRILEQHSECACNHCEKAREALGECDERSETALGEELKIANCTKCGKSIAEQEVSTESIASQIRLCDECVRPAIEASRKQRAKSKENK